VSLSDRISKKRRSRPQSLTEAGLSRSLEEAAEDGDWWSAFQLGCHLNTSEPERARHFFDLTVDGARVEAEADNVDAMYCVADIYKWRNPRLSESWFEAAAAAGHYGALSRLAMLDEKEYTPPQAIQSEVEKARNLQSIYERGVVTEGSGGSEAIRLFELAAKQGHLLSMLSLAHIFWEREERQEAKRWWLAAATRGNVSAMLSLGGA
jgi:TPR repeat protein